MVIRLPCLLDDNMQLLRPLRPLEYKLTDNLTPLSTASLSLESADDIPFRSFVELFTADGSAGIFRVNNIQGDHAGIQDYALQHGLCTLSDHMHPGESTETGSCRTLLTKILSNQTHWTLGTVDVPDDKDLTWECKNTNDLQGLLSVMKELPAYYLNFDQSTLPWVLHVRLKPTEVSCEARVDRNLTEVSIEYDDAEMCTVAYAEGLSTPIRADTISQWGEIERQVSVDKDLGVDLITETVERYLEQAKNPKATIKLTALELSRLTGEPFDHFQKGMLCRCILDHMTVVQRIVSIEHPDPIGEPMNVILTLASTQNDLGVTVAGLVVDIRRMNMLYDELAENLIIEAQTIDMLAAEIDLKATKAEVDGVSTRISEAEIQLNEILGQLALRVTYKELETELNEVSVLLDAVNAELALKATHSDLEDGMNEVTLRMDAQDDTIEMQAGQIILKADKTYVDSLAAQYATITELESLQAKVSDLEAGLGDFTVIDANVVNAADGNFTFLGASSFSFAGSTVSQRAISMGTVSSAGNVLSTGALDLQHSHAVTVDGGTITLGEVSSTGGSFRIADTQFYKDGVSAAKDSVTLTSMGWIGGANVVEASNGKSLRVTLPPFSSSGGDTFSADHKTTVYFYTASVSSPLLSVEIDATSVYEAGYQAAKDAVEITAGVTWSNPAQYYAMVRYWAEATIDGEQVAYTSASESRNISGYV